jgi:hypothetical protein
MFVWYLGVTFRFYLSLPQKPVREDRFGLFCPELRTPKTGSGCMIWILYQSYLPWRIRGSYRAWIRTMNNASKGRCVTVTPRGKKQPVSPKISRAKAPARFSRPVEPRKAAARTDPFKYPEWSVPQYVRCRLEQIRPCAIIKFPTSDYALQFRVLSKPAKELRARAVGNLALARIPQLKEPCAPPDSARSSPVEPADRVSSKASEPHRPIFHPQP